MPLELILLIGVGAAGLVAAAYVYMQELSRREAVERNLGLSEATEFRRRIRRDSAQRLKVPQSVLELAPSSWSENATTRQNLIQAGHDSPSAPLVYALIRIALLVSFPLLVFLFGPRGSFFQLILWVFAAAIIAFMLPVYFLHRGVRVRQEKIRRALPDALDLLVVCVEAGISLDAAILRVARELVNVHPDLSGELMVVNRKTNAGVTREDALRGLWERTGVDEVRSLVASLIQSEKWGSSSARVLRVGSETLRRKRRQAAEKKAATAPIKMLVPLGLLIFPALFVVILGPTALNIIAGFRGR